MLLTLELEEIADGEVLGAQPVQEERVVLGGADEVDMVVGRQPLLLLAGGDGLQIELDGAGLVGGEGEVDGGGFVEEAVVGLQAVGVAAGDVKLGFALSEDEVRLVARGDFQGLDGAVLAPDSFAVEDVHAEGQLGVDGAEAEGGAALEQVDAGGDGLTGVGEPDDDADLGGVLGTQGVLSQRQAEA